MTNGKTNNGGFFSGLITFLKGNPLFTILSGLFLLAFILPPRKRKRKSSKSYSRRRKKYSNPGKVKKSKKAKKSRTGSRTTKIQRSEKPAFMVKGSAAAKSHMAHLRSLRKK